MASSKPPRRPIRRLLVANRGEIATRIIQAARELDIETFALTTKKDTSHAIHAAHAIELPSPAAYLAVDAIVTIAKQHDIDAIHPGYGFLSESPDLARRAWQEAGVAVVGPGADILDRTGDKLAAKRLAHECGVPTLPATAEPTQSVDAIRAFVHQHGLPVMLKAVDGGGGRGIRLVRSDAELDAAAARAMAESPSRRVFVERAAVDAFRHVEVQVVGDGAGAVRHLWERECSVQRRYQKIVELAPSTLPDRVLVGRIVAAAVRMAQAVDYLSLGTFEFLANPDTRDFFFLEINPRLQVEHTVTEAIAGVDIVKTQLQIAQGASLAETDLRFVADESPCPSTRAVQLRLTAENVHANWSLSVGRLSSFRFPTGSGIRVDTSLISGVPAVVSADFDPLLAKIIVSAADWAGCVARCRRALADTRVDGVKTNIDVLRGIVASADFAAGKCDTTWLEANLPSLLHAGERISASITPAVHVESDDSHSPSTNQAGSASSSVLLRKGDAWAITLSPASHSQSPQEQQRPTHHLTLKRVQRNEFPTHLRGQVELTTAGSDAPTLFELDARSAPSAAAGSVAAAGKHRLGSAADARHVVVPFAGRLVEVLVDEGDVLRKGQVVCVVAQMKMELEVRAKVGGRVVWVTEAEDGEEVPEGLLACVIESEDDGRAKL